MYSSVYSSKNWSQNKSTPNQFDPVTGVITLNLDLVLKAQYCKGGCNNSNRQSKYVVLIFALYVVSM